MAFITTDMLPPFKLVMEDLQASGIRGTIITGTYLAFNQPRVFAELLKISNLTVRIADGPSMPRAIFLTMGTGRPPLSAAPTSARSALLANQEWCLKVDSQTDSALPRQLAAALADLTGKSQPLTYTWLADYEKSWQPPAKPVLHVKQEKIVPNQMQAAALENLQASQKRRPPGPCRFCYRDGENLPGGFGGQRLCPPPLPLPSPPGRDRPQGP